MISPSNYVKSLAKLAVGLGLLSALTLASGGSFFLTTWSAEAAPSFSPHLTSVVSMPVGPVAEPAQGRVVRVVDATVNRGQDNDVTITIASQGDENSLGFSLVFDPAQVNFVKAVSGLDAGSASVNLNLTQVGQGRVGISVALPAGQTFAGGIRSALIVTFAVLSTSNVNQTLVAFGDLPVVREVADANAAPLPATFADGTLTITPAVNEAARITSLSPSSATVGGPDFVLTINGANFVNGSVVKWNGQDRATTFVSSMQLTAQIPATDLETTDPASITVVTPPPGGGTSNAISFTINNPTPSLTNFSPNFAALNGPGFTLVVMGNNFVPGAIVRWGGQDRATSFVSSTQLTAQLLAADLATPVTVQITVFNPPPDGGLSDTRLFTVTNPAPQVTALNPATVPAGGAAFNLTVTGSGFTSSSVVRVNGQDRATSFVSSTQLTAAIPSSDVAAPGTIAVSVFNSGPGGAASNSVNLTVGNPPAQITGLSPSSVSAGGAAFALTVTGSGFVQGSVVRVNGQNRATSFVSTTQLTAAILAADIAAAGSLSIVVVNPAPGGGTSNAATLQVGILAPVISSLGPNTAAVGTAGLTLTVTGSGFVSGAVVRWNGQDRATTFVSGTQLTAAIPATDLASIGTASVTVVNPGGGQSNAVVFTTTQTSCVAICYDSAEYWVLNPARMPDGTVSIGRPGYLAPVRIGSNRTEVQRALAGGPSALQQLNSEWVALQLNVIVGVGGFSTAQGVGLLNSSLSCQGANIAPVALASGVTLSSSSQLGDLVDQIKSAIQGNRTGDMELLAPIARLINGDSALSRCRISRASDN